MKYIYNILIAIILGVSINACSPHEDSERNAGDIVSAEDISLTITEDKETSNLFYFTLDTPECIGLFTSDELNLDEKGNEFSRKILWKGDYVINVQVYNRAGLSEVKAISFSVKKDDPEIEKDKNLMNLTGGINTPKTWVWDSTLHGHLGCGEPTTSSPGWWATGDNELAGREIYDDEIQFVLSRESSFLMKTNGKIYVNESAAKTMDPISFPEGSAVAVVINYEQPEGQKWSYLGNKIQFSGGGFPSYIAHPDAINGTYTIVNVTETTLSLTWQNSGIKWYYNFKVK